MRRVVDVSTVEGAYDAPRPDPVSIELVRSRHPRMECAVYLLDIGNTADVARKVRVDRAEPGRCWKLLRHVDMRDLSERVNARRRCAPHR
jgi:hypothetical protein